MRFSPRSKLSILFSFLAIVAVVGGFMATGAIRSQTSKAHAAAPSMHINCASGSLVCSEVYDSESVFGQDVYVGHDEPSTLFYSNVPGSGNRMRYQLTLPKDPTPTAPQTPGKSYNFQLHPAFWFGMAMCDTQSFPEQVSTCKPDSDTNIVDPTVSPNHPGTAFMEMQFYPPGWAPWPAGNSCDATKWCAALNIDSLSENAVTGAAGACAGLTGVEPVNFAFITKNGVPQPGSPPNPLQSTINTFTPDPNADLFMNSGDTLAVTMHDTAHGLQIVIHDQTTGQTGSMTSSAANGFGQVPFSGACNNIPYDFHPMYSTSSEKTRVTWAAHSYNIAFADETGHFDYCNGTNAIIPGGTCPTGNTEGNAANSEPTDGDDGFCFPATSSTLVQVPGCLGTNTGFDGVPYTPVWPDGNTRLHPTSILFTSPLTGSQYNVNYSRMAFEADLPRIEASGASSSPYLCDRNTGAGCTLIPSTDDGTPAAFYPFFSIKNIGGSCVWQLGNHIPGSKNDFGQNAQYGTLLNSTYTAVGGGVTTRYNNFRQILSKNPCAANTN
ncbi:MAG TPA: hypothetical protein VNE38_02810 [Ktedonobacteraceae bacterium]|nr:hypothetical protein [Ktedonobacteraceae bacterium]